MKSNARVDSKRKPTKSLAINAENAENAEKPKQNNIDDVSKNTSAKNAKAAINAVYDTESYYPDPYNNGEEVIKDYLYTLKYNINENGIGQILLPPSLSILLQSDRVCISPSAGGLFIKSV